MFVKHLQSLFEERQLVHASAGAMFCPLVAPELIVVTTIFGTGDPLGQKLGLDRLQQAAIIGSSTTLVAPLGPEAMQGHLPLRRTLLALLHGKLIALTTGIFADRSARNDESSGTKHTAKSHGCKRLDEDTGNK
jgi:hypothetical protein